MERSVAVRLSIDPSGLVSGLATAGAAVNSFAARTKATTDSSIAVVERQSAAWGKVGSTLTTVGAIGAAGLGLMAKSAMDWEQQFTGVVKTTDVTGAAMNRLEGELRGMAKTMPATHKEIAGVAEAAGQLGVKSEDIAGFTRQMVMMGASTNLSSEEAATGIAQMMNIMGTVPQNVGRVASTIVALGNAGASTEKQILDMGQRISGAGNQVKMSEDQVLAYANALASVGINAEAGGTAMSKVFLKLDGVVRDGGKRLESLNRIAGVDFKKAFQEDAAGATYDLVRGLGKLQASGGDVAGALADLGIKGQYERDAMMRLAGATLEAGAAQDVLGDSLRTGAEAWKSQSALMDEYGKFANTTQAKAKIAWNQIKDAGIGAGQALLPAVAEIARTVGQVADAFGRLSPGQLKFGVTAAAVVAGAALIGGAIIKTVTSVAALQGALATLGATNAASALAGLGSAASGLVTRLGGLKGIAAGAGVALVALAAVRWAGSAYQEGVDKTKLSIEGMGNAANAAARGNFAELNREFANSGSTVRNMGDAFKAAGRSQNDFFRVGQDGLKALTGANGFILQAEASIKKLDSSLRDMDLSKASAAFNQIAAENQRVGVSVAETAAQLPQYKAKLEGIARQLDITGLSAQDYADWMGGKIPDAVRKAAEATPAAAKAIADVGVAAKNSNDELEDLIKAVQSYGNQLLALSGSQIGVEAAIDSATEALKENGRTLDLDTAKGRANQSALNDLAGASMKYVENLALQGASVKEQNAAIAKARGEYERLAAKMGMSRDRIRETADAFFQTVAPADAAAAAAGKVGAAAGRAASGTRQLGTELAALPPSTQVKISGDGIPAVTGSLMEVRRQLDGLPLARLVYVTLPNGEKVLSTVSEMKAKLDALPPEKRVPVSAPGADQARAQIEQVVTELGAVPADKKVIVSAPLIGNVATDIGGIIKQLDALKPDVPVTITLPNGDKIVGTAGEVREAVKSIPTQHDINLTTNAPQTAGIANGATASIAAGVARMWENIQGTSATKSAAVEGQTGGWRERVSGIFGDLRGRAVSTWSSLWGDVTGIAGARRGEIESGTAGWRDRVSGIVSDLRGRATSSWNGLWADAAGTGSARRSEIEGGTSGWRERTIGIFNDLRGRAGSSWSELWRNLEGTTDRMASSIRAKISELMGALERSFSSGVSSIGRAWSGIEPKASAPARFVMENVYNNGIREGFNKLAGLFKMDGLPRMNVNFARGGIMPGYSPGRDIYDFYDPRAGIRLGLSGGEAIMRPEVASLLGPAGVDTINQAAAGGGQRGAARALAGVLEHLHFAKGGVFPDHQAFAGGGVFGGSGRWTPIFEAGVRAAAALSGQTFSVAQRGFRPATSYSGTSHAGDAIDLMPSGSWLGAVAALRTMGIPTWDRTGKGNWVPHLHGVPLPGFGLPLGSAIWQAMDYLRGGDGLGGRDNGPRIMPGGMSADAIQALAALAPMDGGGFNVRGLFTDSLSKAKEAATSPWGTAMSKLPGLIVDGITKKAEDLIPGMASGGYTGYRGRSKADDLLYRLSAREFVQPEEAVDHYGLDVMEALRQRKIPAELFSDGFSAGGPVGQDWRASHAAARYAPQQHIDPQVIAAAVAQAVGKVASVTYAPVLVNTDEDRQYEDFSWRFLHDVNLGMRR